MCVRGRWVCREEAGWSRRVEVVLCLSGGRSQWPTAVYAQWFLGKGGLGYGGAEPRGGEGVSGSAEEGVFTVE